MAKVLKDLVKREKSERWKRAEENQRESLLGEKMLQRKDGASKGEGRWQVPGFPQHTSWLSDDNSVIWFYVYFSWTN